MSPLLPPTYPVAYDPVPMQVMALVFIVTIIALYAGLTWLGRHGDELRTHVHCPLAMRRAKVIVRTARDGTRTDVVRCSIIGRRPITCGKPCLAATASR